MTSRAAVPADARSSANLVARASGIVAGVEVARLVFLKVDPSVTFTVRIADGSAVKPGDVVATIEGNSRSILEAERVALNFVQRLSGVATLTRHFVDALDGSDTRVLDTRKTTPGMRDLEKWAVALGGGVNHRHGLWDMYLVKDNHIRAAGSLTNAVRLIERARDPKLKLEVEADSLDLVREALTLDVDIILLDNMTLEQLRESVARARASARKPELEASGRVNLDTVRAIAETGVDYVSIGALTHSARALDLGLDFTS